MDKTQLLSNIDDPVVLQNWSTEKLNNLAQELRSTIIHTVAKNGGHLAPSLGTIELTLALYSIFDFKKDKLVWDVGHQAYAHKLLTGRYEQFHTLRQKGGITGFPKRSESPYDAFGVGHASTSVSAALGMALARDLNRESSHAIAVIGDGALTGGEAFEALNHAGDLGRRLIVILNDNEMSIDRNVGALSTYLSQIRVTPQYAQAKKDVQQILRSIPGIGDTMLKTMSHIKTGVRSALVPDGMFDFLGFHYVGPIDGHDISLLKLVLSRAKALDAPVLIHLHTKKGKGYLPAEQHPDKFHGVGKFDEITGEVKKGADAPPSYTEVFGKTLVDFAKKMPEIVAITAAMPSGTGLKTFAKHYPQRFFDVGIAEQHASTLAAGLAAGGKRPVVAVYSTFAQRAYDQIVHDICLQKLPVTFCLDRAGLVGEDGPTHHGVFDFSYLRHIPNAVIMAPKDEAELQQMLLTAITSDMPAFLRYSRGAAVGVPLMESPERLEIGKGEILSDQGGIALLAVGTMVEQAKEAGQILSEAGIPCTIVNMRFVKPLDQEMISSLAAKCAAFVTLEENALAGGFGSAVAEYLMDEGLRMPLLRIGIPDEFIEQGARKELFELCGFLPQQIAERIQTFSTEGKFFSEKRS